MKTTLLLFMVLLYGCCSEKELIREVPVYIHDTITVKLPAETVFDTVYIKDGSGESIKYIVKTDTILKTVMIKGKERQIKVPVYDTVYVDVPQEKEESFIDKIENILYLLLVIGIIGGIVQIFRK
jgi:hypothetical protein